MYANNFTKMLIKKLNIPIFIIFFLFNYKLVLSDNEIYLIFKNSSSQVCELVKKNISLEQNKDLVIDKNKEVVDKSLVKDVTEVDEAEQEIND